MHDIHSALCKKSLYLSIVLSNSVGECNPADNRYKSCAHVDSTVTVTHDQYLSKSVVVSFTHDKVLKMLLMHKYNNCRHQSF